MKGRCELLDIRLDGRSSIYEQIYGEIVRLISTGALAPDEKLPAVRETAKKLGINPNTVQKAYAALEQNGLIYSIPAKGSYVAGGGSAAEKIKQEAAAALGEAMRKAAEAGVSRSEADALADGIWSDRNNNNAPKKGRGI